MPATDGDPPVVVATPLATTSQSVTRTALAAIFGVRLTTWSDGTPIRVLVPIDGNPVSVVFCKHILYVFSHLTQAAWDRLVFFAELAETAEGKRFGLNATDGSIGY